MLSLLVPSGQVVLFQNLVAGQVVDESDTALVMFAPVRFVLVRFAFCRIALVMFAPVRFVLVRFASCRFANCRFASVKFAPARLARCSIALLKSASVRLT